MMSRITLNLRRNLHLEATEPYISTDTDPHHHVPHYARNTRTRTRNPSESMVPLRGGGGVHRTAASRDLEVGVLDISSERGEDSRFSGQRLEWAGERGVV